MPEARKALHLVHKRAGEQVPGRGLAVPVDVVEHGLVVVGGAGTPVDDLLAGELLEGQLLVVVDVGEFRLRSRHDDDWLRRSDTRAHGPGPGGR